MRDGSDVMTYIFNKLTGRTVRHHRAPVVPYYSKGVVWMNLAPPVDPWAGWPL